MGRWYLSHLTVSWQSLVRIRLYYDFSVTSSWAAGHDVWQVVANLRLWGCSQLRLQSDQKRQQPNNLLMVVEQDIGPRLTTAKALERSVKRVLTWRGPPRGLEQCRQCCLPMKPALAGPGARQGWQPAGMFCLSRQGLSPSPAALAAPLAPGFSV